MEAGALESCWAHEAENESLAQAAGTTFAEWDNPEDDGYDAP
mgnify:FL=1